MRLLIADAVGRSYALWPEHTVPAGFIAEDRTYALRLVDIPDHVGRAGCHLAIGGVDLGAGRHERSGNLSWAWQVSEYIGRVEVAIEQQGHVLIPAGELLVNPSLHKLTQQQFSAMVENISAEALVAFSLSPSTRDVTIQQAWQRLGLSQLEYLRQRLAELQRAVEVIARRPLRRLDEQEVVEPLAAAPSADDRSLTYLIQHLEGAIPMEKSCLPSGAWRIHGRLRGALPTDISVRRRLVTFDVYENRLLKHFLERLCRVVRRTHSALLDAAADAGLDADIRRLADRRAADLMRCRRVLYDLLDLDFLVDVGTLQTRKPVTSALRKDPLYMRFHALFRQFDRAISPFDGGPFQLSMEKSWQLYEYWCFFEVIRALRRICRQTLSFDAHDMLGIHRDRVSLAMPSAEVTISRSISVHFQKSYAYYGWSETSVRRHVGTYSHEMRPDISIEILDGTGEVQEIILLDPKYRVAAGSINQSLDDLHRYKDAIVDRDRSKLVSMALVLCPRDTEAKSLYFDPAYIAAHGLGAVMLAPGVPDTWQRLVELMSEVVGPHIEAAGLASAVSVASPV